MVYSMADLLYIDRTREGSLLRIVTLESNPVLLVRDVVGCDGRVMAVLISCCLYFSGTKLYLTCSEISSVVPAESTHFPINSSPKNGLRGFFSFPNFSLRLAYDCFKVLRNHFKTSKARFCGSGSAAGATKIEGFSAQYEENSTRDVEDRINGGAVRDDRSPENEAIDFKNAPQEPLF